MTTARQRQILDWLEQAGAGSYQELADRLGVSTMTVRREIDRLAASGQVIKTLGGVQRADAPGYLMETAIHGRMGRNRVEKQAMARTAIEIAAGAETLSLDGSTTCLELAKLIARRLRGVTVVTNSALTALEVGRNRNNVVVGVGGEFDPNSCCFVGSVAEESAERYYVDVAFISTMGFLPAEGTFESTVANFRVKQILSRRARKVVLLVDHSKFGQRALARVLAIDEIDTVVTDEACTAEDLVALEERGIEVRRASLAGEDAHVA